MFNKKIQENPGTIYSLDYLQGRTEILSSLRHSRSPSDLNYSPFKASLAILPHHTLATDYLATAWPFLEQANMWDLIVLISPAHENQGKGLVQTTIGTWDSEFGITSTDDELVQKLVDTSIVTLEPDSFQKEHGIGAQIAYISDILPGIKVLPIIAKSTAGINEVHQLLDALIPLLPEDTLIVSSLDFSHGLPATEALKRDEVTLKAIQTYDYQRIDGMSQEYLDSSFSLESFLVLSQKMSCKPHVVWHGTSANFLHNPLDPSTSYFWMECGG